MEKAKHPDLHSRGSNVSKTSSDPLKTTRCTYNELLNTCTYGVEYVLDEIFKDSPDKSDQKSAIDWFGISDLTMD
jgi:hypothetical protein